MTKKGEFAITAEELPVTPAHADDLGILCKKVNDRMKKLGNAHLKSLGITMVQSHVLMVINDSDTHTRSFKELERYYRVAQATMAGILSRLEEKGLIEVKVDPNDRRAKLATISKKGSKLCAQASTGIDKSEAVMRSRLTDEEAEELRRMLTIVLETLQDVEVED